MRKGKSKGRRALAATWLATSAIFAAMPAVAQQDPQVEARGQLDEIVVTAQRRAENLQDVPISVTALSGEDITAAGVSNTIDLNVAVPGLNSVTSVGFMQPFIRGVGSTSNGAGIEAPVATYVDGVYIASAPAALFSFSDIERVEVLKGPQGTLFGRNATGGLIQIITKNPTDRRELQLKLGYSSFQTIELAGYAAGPIGNGIKANLAVQYRKAGDGAGRNFTTGRDAYKIHYDLAVRGKIMIDLGPDTSLTLAGDYFHRRDNLAAFRIATDYPPAPVPGYGPVTFSDIPSRVWDSRADQSNDNELEGGGGSARLEHDFGGVKLMNLAAYRKTKLHYRVDADTLPVDFVWIDSHLKDWTFTEELQLQSDNDSALKWVAGVYYFKNKSRLDPQVVYIFGGPTPARRVHYPAKSLAGYGEATVDLGSATHLTGGLRYTKETRRRTDPGNAAVDDKATSSKLNWRVSLDHQLSPDSMLYATAGTGFKSGGFSGSDSGYPAYKPETIKSYEVGFKTQFADNRVRLNAAAFYYDYSNLQVERSIDNGVQVYNGAKARVKGIDAELSAIASENLSLTGGISYLDAEFVRFPNGIGSIRLPTGGYAEVIDQDFRGNRTPASPKLTASLMADLHFPTASGEWGGSVNYYYNDGFFMGVDNVHRQKSYHMINMTARWKSPDEKYLVSLWVRNFLNAEVLNQKLTGSTNALEAYQPPRTLGATITANF